MPSRRSSSPETFVRIHRCHIVNIEQVRELQPWFNGEYVVFLKNGTRLTLSRGYRERLQERVGRTISYSSEGLRPSDSPTRSLARRFAGSLRLRGSLRSARSRSAGSHSFQNERLGAVLRI